MAQLTPQEVKKIIDAFAPFAPTVTMEDPWGGTFTFAIGDLYDLLRMNDSEIDNESAHMVYAHLYRAEAYAIYESEKAEIRYAAWKKKLEKDLRESTPEKKTAKGTRAAKQGPTAGEIEAYYRTQKEYEKMATEEARWRAIAMAFQGCRRAFDMKAKAVATHLHFFSSFERHDRSVETQRLTAPVQVSAHYGEGEDEYSYAAELAADAARVAAALQQQQAGEPQPAQKKRRRRRAQSDR